MSKPQGKGNTLLQINLHKCKQASNNLAKILTKGGIEVCLIQEPYAYKGKIRSLGSCGKLFYNANETQPRACVITSPNVKAEPLTSFCLKDLVAVVTEWKFGKVVYASAYMPYEETCPPPAVVELTRYCRDSNLPLILGCDANAHHHSWGSSNTNARGQHLFEFINESDLCCINKGNKPTFVVKNREEVIDITLVSTSILNHITNWWVDDEESLSDHRFIKATLNFGSPVPIFVRNRKKTDWLQYYEYVEDHLHQIPDSDISTAEGIDLAVDQLNKVLMSGFNMACPLKPVTIKKSHSHFWNTELGTLRKACRKQWRIYRINKTPENRALYCSARNAYSKQLQKAQKQGWKDFCSSIESTSEASRLHKILKDDKFIKLGRLETGSGYTSDESQSVTELLDQHFPKDADLQEAHLELNNIDLSEVDKIVTPELVEKAVRRFSPFKAAGEDGIFPSLLQAVIGLIKVPLTKIFKACLLYGYIPISWRKTRVVFLPKPGKQSYEKGSSWRPISLMSFELKTLERLVDWYIRTPELIKKLRRNNQFAYIAGVSTDAAIHQVVARAEGAIKTGEYAICVFLDIKGAFNEIKFSQIERAMKRHNISVVCQRFISEMLRNREVTSRDITKKVERGCPQGGILSPILWNLVADELLEKLKLAYPQVYSAGYADDIEALSRGPDVNIVREHAQKCVNLANSWTLEVGLGLAEDKVAVLFFGNQRRRPRPLSLNGQEIPYSPTAKYLGVTIDTNLNWSPHCKERAKKAMMAIATCKRAIGPKWGLKPKVLMWIYKAIVRPILTYGSLSWCTATMTKARMSVLGRVQRTALLGITGAMRSTGTSSLEALLNVEPIDLYIQASALKTMLRLMIHDQWLGWYGRGFKGPLSHMDLCLRHMEQIPELSQALDSSLTEAKGAITRWSQEIHKDRWARLPTCQHTKLFIGGPYERDRGNLLDLSRTALRMLVQVITGHNTLNHHAHKMGLVSSPVCVCGMGEETGIHFMIACDKFVLTRFMELGLARLSDEDLKKAPFKDLALFIVKTGRFVVGDGSLSREGSTPSSQ